MKLYDKALELAADTLSRGDDELREGILEHDWIECLHRVAACCGELKPEEMDPAPTLQVVRTILEKAEGLVEDRPKRAVVQMARAQAGAALEMALEFRENPPHSVLRAITALSIPVLAALYGLQESFKMPAAE